MNNEAFWSRAAPRFWSRVDERGPDECWQWTGPVTEDMGYGQTTVSDVYRLAHRVAFALSRGPIPEGLCVLHRCDNPPCCNPEHLRLGSQLENLADRDAKGRQARGPGAWAARRSYRGAANPRAKLSDSDVGQVRALHVSGVSFSEIGRRFGVSATHVERIVRGKCRSEQFVEVEALP